MMCAPNWHVVDGNYSVHRYGRKGVNIQALLGGVV